MDVGEVVLHVHVDLFAVRTSIDLCVPAADCEPEGRIRQMPPSRRLRGWARRTYQERTSSNSRRGLHEELRRKDGRRHGAPSEPAPTTLSGRDKGERREPHGRIFGHFRLDAPVDRQLSPRARIALDAEAREAAKVAAPVLAAVRLAHLDLVGRGEERAGAHWRASHHMFLAPTLGRQLSCHGRVERGMRHRAQAARLGGRPPVEGSHGLPRARGGHLAPRIGERIVGEDRGERSMTVQLACGGDGQRELVPA